MKALPIGPEEAFVLSRVDGSTPESAIVLATGLDAARVAAALSKLSELGAVTFNGSGSSTASVASSAGSSATRPAVVDVQVTDDAAHSQPPRKRRLPPAVYDPLELEEQADLDLQRKQAILDAYHRLNGVDHYQLLGVEPTAEKKEIKRAYYDAVAIFHPDKYFGKQLGNFKPKLEKVFAGMTEAHDVLTRKRSRAEYDEYLASRRKTRALEEYLAGGEYETPVEDEATPSALELASTPPAPIAESDPSAASAKSEPGPAAPATEQATQNGEPTGSGSRPPTPDPSRPPGGTTRRDSEARRRALMRKLASRSSAPPPGGSAPPPVDPEAAQSAAAEALKHRYDHRTAQAKQAQLDRYLTAAQESEDAGNAVGAANALRIAVALSPDDEILKARLDAAQNKAGAELAETYAAQARYEEQNFHYEAAARSYSRAAAGKPSARTHQQAAHCYLEAGTDPRAATAHARKAVSLAPTDAEARITLARAYMASDMRQSALAELERAAAQDPKNDAIKQHIKRVKRGLA